jgi:hypothetical protein
VSAPEKPTGNPKLVAESDFDKSEGMLDKRSKIWKIFSIGFSASSLRKTSQEETAFSTTEQFPTLPGTASERILRTFCG